MKLSTHFDDTELFSPVLLKTIYDNNGLPEWYIMDYQLSFLEFLRTKFNKPILVNIPESNLNLRGFCSDNEDICVGRDITSQHNRGGAFDITIPDITPQELAQVVRTNKNYYKIGGLGVSDKDNFCHVDFRRSLQLVEWTY